MLRRVSGDRNLHFLTIRIRNIPHRCDFTLAEAAFFIKAPPGEHAGFLCCCIIATFPAGCRRDHFRLLKVSCLATSDSGNCRPGDPFGRLLTIRGINFFRSQSWKIRNTAFSLNQTTDPIFLLNGDSGWRAYQCRPVGWGRHSALLLPCRRGSDGGIYARHRGSSCVVCTVRFCSHPSLDLCLAPGIPRQARTEDLECPGAVPGGMSTSSARSGRCPSVANYWSGKSLASHLTLASSGNRALHSRAYSDAAFGAGLRGRLPRLHPDRDCTLCLARDLNVNPRRFYSQTQQQEQVGPSGGWIYCNQDN